MEDGLSPLSIWNGFDGSGGDWQALSYSTWMAGFDANFSNELNSGQVVKSDCGPSSNGVDHIYSYVAGAGQLAVLLLAGQNGEEMANQWATMRWFEQFVRSSDPAMQYLRSRLKVIYVPTASPSAYNIGRVNSNAVDPNRNYDFYWSMFSPPSQNFAKGTAPFSELESTNVKNLVDAYKVSCLIDCHNMPLNSVPQSIMVSPSSPWILGKRHLAYGAADLHTQLYGGSWAEITDSGFPTVANWFAKHVLTGNQASVVLDTNADQYGSTVSGFISQRTVSQQFVQNYAGMITVYLLRWLIDGQMPQVASPMRWRAARLIAANATSMASGGTLLDVAGPVSVTFDNTVPSNTNSTPRNYLSFIFPCPGNVHIKARATLQGGGNSPTRVDAQLLLNGSAQSESYASVVVPQAADQCVTFCTSARLGTQVTADAFWKAALSLSRPAGGDPVKLLSAEIVADFLPTPPTQKSTYLN